MMKAKKPPKSAMITKIFKKQRKERAKLLRERRAAVEQETARIEARNAAARKNYSMELAQIQGELAMLRPGVAADKIATLKRREKQLMELTNKG